MHVQGELAGFVDYRLRGHAISLVHTEVEPAFRGAHLATHLARFSLDDARKRGLAVLPSCPYISSWIKKHPDYTDLVPRGPPRRVRPGRPRDSDKRETEAITAALTEATLTRVWLPDSPEVFGGLPVGIEADVWTGGDELPPTRGRGRVRRPAVRGKTRNNTEDRDAAQPQDRPDPLRRRRPRPPLRPRQHHALQRPGRAHPGHRRVDGRRDHRQPAELPAVRRWPSRPGTGTRRTPIRSRASAC